MDIIESWKKSIANTISQIEADNDSSSDYISNDDLNTDEDDQESERKKKIDSTASSLSTITTVALGVLWLTGIGSVNFFAVLISLFVSKSLYEAALNLLEGDIVKFKSGKKNAPKELTAAEQEIADIEEEHKLSLQQKQDLAKYFQIIVDLEKSIENPKKSTTTKIVNYLLHAYLFSLVQNQEISDQLEESIDYKVPSLHISATKKAQKVFANEILSTISKINDQEKIEYILNSESLDLLIQRSEDLDFLFPSKLSTESLKAIASTLSNSIPSALELYLHSVLSEQSLIKLINAGLKLDLTEKNIFCLNSAHTKGLLNQDIVNALAQNSHQDLLKKALSSTGSLVQNPAPPSAQETSSFESPTQKRLSDIRAKTTNLLNEHSQILNIEDGVFLKSLLSQGLNDLESNNKSILKLSRPNLVLQEKFDLLLSTYEAHLDEIENRVSTQIDKKVSIHTNYLKAKQ